MSGKATKIILIILAIPLVIFVLGYLLTLGASVPQTVEQDPSIPHVTINGVTFHAEAFGNPENPVVIAVHGGPGDDYRSFLSLKELSDEFYVVFYDQRGTGLSPRVSAEELTLDLTISDLNLIVDHYSHGEKVNLVGHSFGAMLVAPYLGKYPEKVDHAVLSEPGFLTTETAMKYMAYFSSLVSNKGLNYYFQRIKTWFEILHINGPDEQARADYIYAHSGVSAGNKPRQTEFYCNGEYATGESVYWRRSALANQSIQNLGGKSEFVSFDANGRPEFHFTKGVENFDRKVLFIASECNKVIGEEIQSIHMQSFPNAELAVIKGAGHDMFLGKPEEVVKVIREYLNE